MAPRFYTPDTEFRVGERAFLTEKARHHAGRVLRLVAGDVAVLFDGKGRCASGPIAFEGKDGFITVESIESPATETPVRITLLQSLVSPEKMDWIVEKAVETGVSVIAVAPARRSVTKLTDERLQKRLAHWKDIAVSACEQCGRNTVPEIRFYKKLEQAFDEIGAQRRFILSPGSDAKAKLSDCSSVAFAVGPEGGFDADEIASAIERDWQCVLIGPRVLRTETAGIVAATLANVASGDYVID